MQEKIHQLESLKEDITAKTPDAINGFESVILAVLKNVFGTKNEFVSQANEISSGWVVAFKNEISYMSEDHSAKLANGKKEMYLELLENAIHYAKLYMGNELTIPTEGVSQPKIHVDTINAQGAFLNLGQMFDSPVSIDASIRIIEHRIEDEGGEDKKALYETLNEVKSYIDECQLQKEITKKPGLGARINAHVVKHGWFYGAVLQLLGTAALQYIG